jgi:5-methylcytosine-specific restriction endonuclease McrA
MSFVEVEDTTTTVRRKLTPHRRLQVWEKTGGTCVLCHRKINGPRERWIAEHIRALELGGADDLDNMGPAHEECALVKTQDDHRRAAKAKRQKIQYIGAQASKKALPFGKSSPWKRKLSGQIILR